MEGINSAGSGYHPKGVPPRFPAHVPRRAQVGTRCRWHANCPQTGKAPPPGLNLHGERGEVDLPRYGPKERNRCGQVWPSSPVPHSLARSKVQCCQLLCRLAAASLLRNYLPATNSKLTEACSQSERKSAKRPYLRTISIYFSGESTPRVILIIRPRCLSSVCLTVLICEKAAEGASVMGLCYISVGHRPGGLMCFPRSDIVAIDNYWQRNQRNQRNHIPCRLAHETMNLGKSLMSPRQCREPTHGRRLLPQSRTVRRVR